MRLPSLLLCLFFLFSSALRAQSPMLWRQRTSVGSPGQIQGATMAFAEPQAVMLLFGGDKTVGVGLPLPTNDLWHYNGLDWVPVTVTGTKPAARSGHAMVYDPIDQRVLIFGGDAGGGVYLNDLWAFVFSGPGAGSWVQLASLPSAGRRDAMMGYDANRDRFVIVGGIKQGTVAQNTPSGAYSVIPATRETFEWNRTTWSAGPDSALYNNGPTAGDVFIQTVMAGPFNGTLGYHVRSGQLMLLAERRFPLFDIPFANTGLIGGVSEYDGAAWSFKSGGYVNISGGLGGAWRSVSSNRQQSAYDPARGRLVVATGDQPTTLEYDGSYWVETDNGITLPTNAYGHGEFGSLPNRPGFCLGHDTVRGVTVFFGGKASATEPGDTWELEENPAVPFAITTNLVPTMLEPCQGETLTLTAAATGVAPLSFRWFRSGTVIAGVTSTTLTRTNLTPANSGTYTFEVTDPTGRTRTSQPTEVYVHAPPEFTMSPTPRRVVPGETFSIEAAWTSSLPIDTIQWYRGADPIPGANAAVYTKANATVADAGNYVIRLTTRCTTVASTAGRVLVGPIVNQQPAAPSGQSVGLTPVTMNITGDGVGELVGTYTTGGVPTTYPHHEAPDSLTNPRPLIFTWRHEGVPLVPGPKYTFTHTALTSQLVINLPDYEDEGYYDCIVTDICGPTYAKTSVQTLLILHELAPPYLTFPATGPEPRVGSGMVFDSMRGRTVLFGGTPYGYNPRRTDNFKQHYNSNDTWEWDGKVWLKRNPAHRPPALSDFAIAYDSVRGRTVIFGGNESLPPAYNIGSHVVTNAVWEWDGNDWSQPAAPTGSFPPARLRASMCYDSERQEVLMMGGDIPSATVNPQVAVNALWAWNGSQWSVRPGLPFAPGSAVPYVYTGNPFVFDKLRGVAVMFGAFFDSEYPVWEWNGTTWTRALAPIELRLADARDYAGAAFYDPVRRMVAVPVVSNLILYNAGPSISTLVYWNGSIFQRDDAGVIDDVAGGVFTGVDSGPANAQGDLSTFDSARRCLVWLDNQQFYYQGPATTREMHFSAKVKPVHFLTQVNFANNQSVKLRVISAGQRGLVYQWFKDGSTIFDDAHYSGAATATLSLTAITAADTGKYTVRITNLYNQVVTQEMNLGLQAIGVSTVVQGNGLTLNWPPVTSSTGILQTATDLSGPWTDILGVIPPYTVPIEGPARFYRVAYPE